jgi:hypothetical protein
MNTSVLEGLRAQRESLIGEIEALTSVEDFDPADTTFVAARSKADALDGKIRALVEFAASRDAANAVDAMQVRSQRTAETQTREAKDGLTPGAIFTRSRAYEDYKSSPRGTSGHVEVELDQFLQTRAPVLTSTFAGILEGERIAGSYAGSMQTPLLSIIDRIPVSSNSIEWVFYPAAATGGAVVAEGAAKPEAAVAPVLKTVSLEVVASHLTVSRQVAEDGGALMAYIDGAMRRNLVELMEARAAAVLVADTDIVEVLNEVSAGNNDTLLKGIRRAIGAVQTAGFNPQIALLNPSDYAGLDIDVLGKTLNGPVVGSQFWGVAPKASSAVPAGTAWVGDFSTAMAFLARTEVSMYSTDSHASNFTSNLITQLCEARGKAIVHNPRAVVKVEGTV